MKFKTTAQNIIAAIRAIDWKNRRTQGIAGVTVLVVAVLIFTVSSSAKPTEVEAPLHEVTLIDVAAHAQKESVSSEGKATREMVVRAETGGKVTKTLVAGTRVGSGDVIAELENSAQRAALLSAEGSLEAAQAGQDKTKQGLRPEQLSIRETSLENAKNGAVTTLLSAYATMDSSIKDTADKMFYRTGGDQAPLFTVNTKDGSLKNKLQQLRFELDTTLDREAKQANTITTEIDLLKELTLTETEVRTARTFADTALSNLAGAISSDTIPETQITSYRTAMTNVRTALTNTLSAISAARTNLTTANDSLNEGNSYAQSTDLASASASVKQAQGAYASALSAYQKTIIRAGAPGAIVSCSVKAGDVISMGADVCRITTTGSGSGSSYLLPLSSVKYTPAGAYILVIDENNAVKLVPVDTGLVTSNSITVTGLMGTERIVSDIRGLKEGEKVSITN